MQRCLSEASIIRPEQLLQGVVKYAEVLNFEASRGHHGLGFVRRALCQFHD